MRFLWVEPETWDLRFHFLSLYIFAFCLGLSFRPLPSWLCQSIMVDNPLSWMIQVRGAPTRGRLFICSALKALHSGPWFKRFEEITKPHCSHMSSPTSSSRMRLLFPHSGHSLDLPLPSIKIHTRGFIHVFLLFVKLIRRLTVLLEELLPLMSHNTVLLLLFTSIGSFSLTFDSNPSEPVISSWAFSILVDLVVEFRITYLIF